MERNTESTARQYDLVSRARQLGWPREAIRVIDGDLGISGSVTGQRDGFEGMVAEVALGQVGIILALEVSRLARDNAAWYRLLDLAGVCDTLVADADGVYHPALFTDRLVLGLMGIMAESELHVLRARLEGGIKNKAARGELRRGLPVGLIWGEGDGEICFHPDEAVTGVLAAVFEQFAVCGSVRATWLWLRAQHLRWPLQQAVYLHGKPGEITWVEPTYHAVHTTLTHPAYAGAYVYGRTRDERYLGPDGALRTRRRKLPRDQWEVLIPDHHPGFTDWDTYLANQARIGGEHPPAGPPAGHRRGPGRLRAAAGPGHLRHVRPQAGRLLPRPGQDGAELLLPGLCRAGRRPGVPAHERRRAGHRRRRRRRVPGRPPAGRAAGLPARRRAARARPRRGAGPAPPPGRAGPLPGRQGRAPLPRGRPREPAGRPRPGNRMEHRVAAGSPTPKPSSPAARPPGPKALTPAERAAILALGDDLGQVWDAPTTTDKDRKQLLRTLLEEVNITARRDDPDPHARLVLRWKGGAITELTVPLRRPQPKIRTDDDTVDLVRRLAVHYPDANIAGILNRQGRRTPRGLSYTAGRVQGLRHYWGIPRHQPATSAPAEGELLNVAQAARQLGIAPSTLLRWLNDGFIAGEQVTPGAPWRVRLTDQLRGMLTDSTPDGWVALHHASRALGISRQTVLQKVKRGELRAVLTRTGRRKGLRIEIPTPQDGLF